jgi:hypothetical protein
MVDLKEIEERVAVIEKQLLTGKLPAKNSTELEMGLKMMFIKKLTKEIVKGIK